MAPTDDRRRLISRSLGVCQSRSVVSHATSFKGTVAQVAVSGRFEQNIKTQHLIFSEQTEIQTGKRGGAKFCTDKELLEEKPSCMQLTVQTLTQRSLYAPLWAARAWQEWL